MPNVINGFLLIKKLFMVFKSLGFFIVCFVIPTIHVWKPNMSYITYTICLLSYYCCVSTNRRLIEYHNTIV